MGVNTGMMSSKTVEWSTPQGFFDKLNAELGPFDLDPCAVAENAKCAKFYTKAENGLSQPWSGRVFMNPPYGREIGKWIKKAWESSRGGAFVVCLIPARTDTAYWHDFVMKGEVRFVRGRLYFGNGMGPAPFPSAVVIFRPQEPK